jgi:hypothetical protein
MKKIIIFAAACLLTASLTAENSTPKDEVIAAAKQLGAANNYSWKTTVEVVGGRFKPGPTDGKTEKGGFTLLTFTQGDNTAQAVFKDGKGIIKTEDEWQSLADAAKDDGGGPGPARFIAMRLQSFKSPAEEAESFAGKTKDLKLADGVYAGDLTEEGAKASLAFGRPGENGPDVSGAKGSVKFWITDGVLSKYQVHVEGHVEFGGNGRDVNRTSTTEIKDAGKTTVEVPDDAKKKLS